MFLRTNFIFHLMHTINLTMSCGIFLTVCQIMALSNNFPLRILLGFGNKNTSYRNLITLKCFIRLSDCYFHKLVDLLMSEPIFICILHYLFENTQKINNIKFIQQIIFSINIQLGHRMMKWVKYYHSNLLNMLMNHVKTLMSIFTLLIKHQWFGIFFRKNYKSINFVNNCLEWLSKLFLQAWKYEWVFKNFSCQISLQNHQNHLKTFCVHQQKPNHKFLGYGL